tara:strand:+ start:1049 stop:1408 length:360 start_codon:yes stop_codon:yes gene_type:complete
MAIGSMAWGPHCSQGCSVVLADGIAVDPFIFRVMTDRPWEAWREQAGPPSALSIDRLGHPAPHDVPTPQLSFFRRSAEAWGQALQSNAPMLIGTAKDVRAKVGYRTKTAQNAKRRRQSV